MTKAMAHARLREWYRRYVAELTITELLNEKAVLVHQGHFVSLQFMELNKGARKQARKQAREELAIKREVFSAETTRRAAAVRAGCPVDQFALMVVRETRREIAKHNHAVDSATTTPTGGDVVPEAHRPSKRAGKICGGY